MKNKMKIVPTICYNCHQNVNAIPIRDGLYSCPSCNVLMTFTLKSNWKELLCAQKEKVPNNETL